ncbi:Asparagine synthetase domain-containing protein [Entamoeba marina]
MRGFVIEIDKSEKFQKFQKIIQMLNSSIRIELIKIHSLPVKIAFTSDYIHHNKSLTNLPFEIDILNITDFDKENDGFMYVDFSNKITFTTDRFSNRSLLYEVTDSSFILSNLQCSNTAAPNEYYEFDPLTFQINSISKFGTSIAEYYSHLYGERLSIELVKDTIVQQLGNLLSIAVKKCIDDSNDPIVVLFSGGIDSSMVAYYALTHCGNRPVELYNMACWYENTFNSPDRLCAKAVIEDLRNLFPTKSIDFIEIDIDKQTSNQLSQKLIPVIYPNNTVMDLSITTATALALICEGHIGDIKKIRSVKNVLCGQGADEQLGGYARHRNAKKWKRLPQELEKDFCRLWSRNVARDDRVANYCDVNLQFPFLEKDLISFIRNIPLDLLVDLDLPENEGNKWVLRELSRTVGMNACSSFKKTAIQFGTRMAKVMNDGKKVNGAEIVN